MLSPAQIQQIRHDLDHIPKSYTSQQRQNYKKRLQKKLKEHFYATEYEPFVPQSHHVEFINHTTPTTILEVLIRIAQTTTEIMIDTESIAIRFESNQPALLQIELIHPHRVPMIILVETFHLPSSNSPQFTLLKQLFRFILNVNKNIFIWGSRTELYSFSKFRMFNNQQINEMRCSNLQDDFKRYWQKQHPHKSIEPSHANRTTEPCQCEICLNHQPNHLWGLQECIACLLNKYLSKIHTMGDFNIGLDPRLNINADNQIEYRRDLTTYAAQDVLSMQQVVQQIKMNNFQFDFRSIITEPGFTIDSNSDLDDDTQIIVQSKIFKPEPPPPPQTATTTNAAQLTTTSTKSYDDNPLSAEQRHRIHNRTCTLRQRRKAYTYELFIRHIDRKFPIRKMKEILKQLGMAVTQVNRLISNKTDETILRVGIKHLEQLERYEEITKDLFSTHHYRRLFS